MNILITGSYGFLANNLSNNLKKFGFSCYGIGRKKSSKTYSKKFGYLKNINGAINSRNLKKLKKINFQYIIHCAGGVSPNIGLKKFISKTTEYEKNVSSILNVLKYFSKGKKKPKVIFMSSVSVYGNTKSKKIREGHNLKPISNYSISKIMAEKICRFFNKKYNIDILILRGTSLYGPGLKRQVIYDACNKISKNNNIFYGTGREIRDFIHVDDFVRLIKKIILKSFKGYVIINAGSGKGVSIFKIINYINKKFKKKTSPKFNKFGNKVNPISLVPSIAKAKKFNWSPKINFYKGLDEYIDWFNK